MKKWISIILSITMFASLMPVLASAKEESKFTDVSGSEYYSQAADALSELDILEGYDNGSFGASRSITRAEMAAIICRMLDKEKDAEKASGKTDFDDVGASHWASGYINIATDKGIIEGDGDGSFRPEDNVKYEEAIKMVVCALGLGDDVKVDPKDWSAEYLRIANDNKITNDLKGSKGNASTRGDVAVMVYNGLAKDLEAPTASKAEGTYTGTQKIELTTSTKDAVIYYTTDGSAPTTKSTKYVSAVSITKTSTLRAVAVLNDVLVSDEFKAEYTIKSSGGGGGGGGGGGSSSSTTKYTVSFDLNYEGATGAPASQSVKRRSTATEPETPTREGYTFGGWYTDKECAEEHKFDFANQITASTTLYAKWSKSESEILPDSEEIVLYVNNDELTTEENTEIVFYAETSLSVDKIEAVNEDKTIVVEMFDNGDFQNNKDDIKGDGIFSGTCILNYETENLDGFNFYAQAETEEGIVQSKSLPIYSISDFDENDLKIMKIVDDSIHNMINSEFEDKSLEERKQIALALLENLSSESHGIEGYEFPLVVPDSIDGDENSKTIEFLYAVDSGINGTILLEDFDSDFKGREDRGTSRNSENEVENNDSNKSSLILSNSNESTKQLNTIVLHNFLNAGTTPSAAESSWVNAYNTYVNNKLGDISNIDTVTGTTVEDYKALYGYNAIIINSHGSYIKNDPVICLNQIASDDEDEYVKDIKKARIYRANTSSGVHYWLFPSFFKHYYNSKKLNNSIVYLGLCLGYGDKTIDADMANAWAEAGSDAIYAYLNSVNGSYDYYMLEDILDNLAKGETTGSALNDAKQQNGVDDGGDPAAVMNLHGNSSRYLVHSGLMNGSFEEKYKYWNVLGDTRVLSKLAEILPKDKSNMAILTTGIGSGTSSYLEATEGSMLSQTFLVPDNVTTITFSYDVVSEEPLEFVGSQYDDKFLAEIVVNDQTNVMAKESVNETTWIPIYDIDFEGGDSTTYHTGWKEISYDISAYRNQTVTLRFNVYDVGDSVYDTAALIDNVVIK